MEYRHLEYFVCIVKCGSFTKASKTLHLSQPALSKAIKTLEANTGFPLLQRSNQKIQLTEAGKRIYEKACTIISLFEELDDFIQNMSNTIEGHLSVGVPPGIASCIFPSVLSGFYNAYPKIDISYTEEGGYIIDKMVVAGTLALGITIQPIREKNLCCHTLAKSFYSLVVHKSHPLANKKKITLKELSGESFIVYDDTFKSYTNIISGCQAAGFEPQVRMKLASVDLLIELAATKQGITIIPDPVARKFSSDRIKIIPVIDDCMRWEVALIYHNLRPLTLAEKTFARYMQQNAKLSY